MKALPAIVILALAAPASATARNAHPPRRLPPPNGPACIDANRIVSRKVTAPETISLELTGGRRVAMTLAGPCPHLTEIDRTYTIVFDQDDGSRLCRGSRFQVVDPLVARSGGIGSFLFCRVSRFTDLAGAR